MCKLVGDASGDSRAIPCPSCTTLAGYTHVTMLGVSHSSLSKMLRNWVRLGRSCGWGVLYPLTAANG